MTAATKTVTESVLLANLPGSYCGQDTATWSVRKFVIDGAERDYFEVSVASPLIVAGTDVFGTTTDVQVVAAWLIGHDVSPRICDYCTNPATHRVLDATDEMVCRACVVDQTDGPIRDYARRLTETQLHRLMVADLTR